jgi:catechol 2,3-dioxygenase
MIYAEMIHCLHEAPDGYDCDMAAPEHSSGVIGPVTLIVNDLQRCIEFYGVSLGMRLLRSDDATATLGAGELELLHLEASPSAPRAGRSTGLYHLAILLPTRADLARQLRRMLEAGVQLHGGADHDVSEALYLADPEGNGIEIYRDRPREEWEYSGGQIRMGSGDLDVRGLLASADDSTAQMPDGTTMGHIHLRVSDLPAAEAFYREVLGFDVTTRYGNQATFLSKFGYHHHLGLNTWASLGATPPPQGAAGLKHFVIYARDAEELAAVEAKAVQIGADCRKEGAGLCLRDPSGNHVLLLVRKSEG